MKELTMNQQVKIKQYCKKYKLKFEKYEGGGFIASKLFDIKAGMERDIHSNKDISTKIKKVGKKRIYRRFSIYNDLDIIDCGIYNPIKN